MLHPFIPFFTEKLWLDLKLNKSLKKPLMYKDWILPFKVNNSFKKSYQKVDWLIQLVTNIRSTKVDLDISPGAFIDISIAEVDYYKRSIIDNNSSVFKRLGRISDIIYSKSNKNGVKIIVGGETVTLYFDQNFDVNEQKQKISNKVEGLHQKIIGHLLRGQKNG